jgi:alkyl hydroperoxide reductase subunit AhpC
MHKAEPRQGGAVTLQIGGTAPDFEAETTEGRLAFHDWIGDSCAVLFSHPRNLTPVCTSELGYMAKIIEETQGHAPNHVTIGDADCAVSKLYGMLPARTAGDPLERTPADNQTVRNVFVIGPDKKIKLGLVYPMTTGRNIDEVLRVIDSLQPTAAHKVATPGELAPGRRRDHRGLAARRRGTGQVPGRLGVAAAVHPDRAPTRRPGRGVAR